MTVETPQLVSKSRLEALSDGEGFRPRRHQACSETDATRRRGLPSSHRGGVVQPNQRVLSVDRHRGRFRFPPDSRQSHGTGDRVELRDVVHIL